MYEVTTLIKEDPMNPLLKKMKDFYIDKYIKAIDSCDLNVIKETLFHDVLKGDLLLDAAEVIYERAYEHSKPFNCKADFENEFYKYSKAKHDMNWISLSSLENSDKKELFNFLKKLDEWSQKENFEIAIEKKENYKKLQDCIKDEISEGENSNA